MTTLEGRTATLETKIACVEEDVNKLKKLVHVILPRFLIGILLTVLGVVVSFSLKHWRIISTLIWPE